MHFISLVIASVLVHCGSSRLLDEKCLNCICETLSSCGTKFKCNEDYSICGPYLLTELYWIDGERIGYKDKKTESESFVTCAKNKLCSEATMQNYMKRYARDCNKSGNIDCVDYYRIHMFGQLGCVSLAIEKSLPWLKFLKCYLSTADNILEAYKSVGIKYLK